MRLLNKVALLPKFLSDEVSKREFCLMINQWGPSPTLIYADDVVDDIRMRVGVLLDATNTIYCLPCSKTIKPTGVYGLLTVIAEDKTTFMELLVDSTDMFFCVGCSKFVFSDVLRYSDKHWFAHLRGNYPRCNRHVQSYALNNGEAHCNLYASYRSRRHGPANE